MIFVLAGLVVFTVAALVAQGAVFLSAHRRQIAAHTAERGNLVAALIARTPGEYAGLLAGQVRRERGTRADPAEPAPPESRVPLGL